MATIGTLVVNLVANARAFHAGLGMAEAQLKRFGGEMGRLGSTLSRNLSLPLALAGGAAFKAAVNFESAFAGVRKTVDATETQFAQLSAGIRRMSTEIPASTTEISRVAEAAGQLGVKTESILSFTRVMIDLGVATNMTSDQAADALARFANIMQMPQDQFSRLGSTVVDLGNKLAATEAEIVAMGMRLAGAGKTVGMSEAQIMGLAGALASVGVEAELGGSAFSRVMVSMAQSVESGGSKLATFAQVAGMSSAEFRASWERDAAGTLVRFIEGLGGIQRAGGPVFGVLKELGLNNVRVSDSLLRAASAGDLFRYSLQIGSQAWQQNSALSEEANRRYATMAARMTILWNQIVNFAITLGGSLAPALMSILSALTPVVNGLGMAAQAFAMLNPTIQAAVVYFGLFVIALGPLLSVVGSVSMALSALTVVSGYVIAGLVAVAPMLGAIVVAAWPVVAVAAAVAAGIYVWQQWGDTISNAATAALAGLSGAATDIYDTLATMFSPLMAGIAVWRRWGGAVKAALSDATSAVGRAASGIGERLQQLASNAASAVQKLVAAAKQWLVNKLTAVIKAMRAPIDKAIAYFRDLYNKIVGHSYVPEMVDDIGSSMRRLEGDAMVSPVNKACDQVDERMRETKDKAREFADAFTGAFHTFGVAVLSGEKSMGEAMKDFKKDLGRAVADVALKPMTDALNSAIQQLYMVPFGAGNLGMAMAMGGLGWMAGGQIARETGGNEFTGGLGGVAGGVLGTAIGGPIGGLLGVFAGSFIGGMFGESTKDKEKKAAEAQRIAGLRKEAEQSAKAVRDQVKALSRTMKLFSLPFTTTTGPLGQPGAMSAFGETIRLRYTEFGKINESSENTLKDFVQRTQEIAANLRRTMISIIGGGLDEAFKLGVAGGGIQAFSKNLKQSIFDAIREGLAEAFLNTSFLKARLAPIMDLMARTFTPEAVWNSNMRKAIERMGTMAKNLAEDPTILNAVRGITQVQEQISAALGLGTAAGTPGTGKPTVIGYQYGGVLPEPVIGVGPSGTIYRMHEGETVSPNGGGREININLNMEGAVISDDATIGRFARKIGRVMREQVGAVN
jgi:TP901 family phage tail tape measure protein